MFYPICSQIDGICDFEFSLTELTDNLGRFSRTFVFYPVDNNVGYSSTIDWNCLSVEAGSEGAYTAVFDPAITPEN